MKKKYLDYFPHDFVEQQTIKELELGNADRTQVLEIIQWHMGAMYALAANA